jgi:hypothetical protein
MRLRINNEELLFSLVVSMGLTVPHNCVTAVKLQVV